MNKLLLLLGILAWSSLLFSQSNTLSKAEDSDPEATALLKKVKQKYDTYTSMELDFSLSIKLAEQPEEVQKGKLAQKGQQYRLDIQEQSVFFDGKTLWVYLKSLNEVQIMDADFAAEGVMSPQDMLKIYESKDYVYSITNKLTQGGRQIKQIEFKPLKKDAEYSKIRVSIDVTTNDLIAVEAFGKDTSRYTLKVDKLTPNKIFPTDYFKFNPANYPKVYIEDLRG